MLRLREIENVIWTAGLTFLQCCLPSVNIPLKVTVSAWAFFCFTGSFCLNLLCYIDFFFLYISFFFFFFISISMADSYHKEL